MTDRRELFEALAGLAGAAVVRADDPPAKGEAGVRPTAGADAVTIAGLTFVFHTDAKQTGGKLSVVEVLVAPGAGAPPHTHPKYDESFAVLAGTYDVTTDGKKATAGPGDFVHIPGGVLHAFTNTSKEVGRILSVSTPAGLEEFFRAVGYKRL
ncbi:MAG: cupin domain-containing protein [Gemmataceae bacterium]|nr:cupin domain-containing protein [Gemmataceae bacterium]